MDRKLQVMLVAGIIVTAIAAYISIYAGGIVLIIVIALVMSYLIMQDSTQLPDVVAEFNDEAKAIVIRNTGNAPAKLVHVAIVPENIEFDVPALAVEESHTHQLERMLEEVKVVVTFRNEADVPFTRSYRLSAFGDNFEPLKPMIPLFRWK